MHRRLLQVLSITCLFMAIGGSCAIKSEIYVNDAGAGEVSFRIELSPFLLDSLEDIAEMSGTESAEEGAPGLNVDRVRAGFDGKEHVELTSLTYDNPELMTGSFTFNSIDSIFASKKEISETGILAFTSSGREKTIQVTINRDNFADLTDFVPILQNPFVEMFGPAENEGVSEAEYLDMMSFALGEEGPSLIEGSSVELSIRVDGEIVAHTGGILRGGVLVIEIPLLELLLLPDSLQYSVTYR